MKFLPINIFLPVLFAFLFVDSSALYRNEFQNAIQSSTGIVELVLKVSNQDSCRSDDCRSHEEAKDLVACKIGKLASLIDQQRQLVYTHTEFKAKSKGEASKFVFSMTKKPPTLNQTNEKKSSGISAASMVRVCVPIDTSKDAWIDARCPYDPCQEEVTKTCYVSPPKEFVSKSNTVESETEAADIVGKKLEKKFQAGSSATRN